MGGIVAVIRNAGAAGTASGMRVIEAAGTIGTMRACIARKRLPPCQVDPVWRPSRPTTAAYCAGARSRRAGG
jgi:hypothetical protein